MGVSPSSVEHIYVGQESIKGTFTIISGEEKNIHISPLKEIPGNIILLNGVEREIKEHIIGSKTVNFEITLPEGLSPGLHKIVLVSEQYFTPEELIQQSGFAAGTAAIAFVIKIRVPNDGKFLEVKHIEIEPSPIKVGDVVYFTLPMLNLGTDDLTNLNSDIIIKNPEGEEIASSPTNTVERLPSGERGSLKAFFRTEDQNAGAYLAQAEIDYGTEAPLKRERGFNIGDIFIKILEVRTDLNDTISRIFITVESNWNEEIQDVYAELTVKDNNNIIDILKTSSIDIPAWSEGTLTAFWERGSIPPGDYSIDIKVFYFDKEANEYVLVTIPEPIAESIEAEKETKGTLMILAVALLALILVINLLWFFIKSRKK